MKGFGLRKTATSVAKEKEKGNTVEETKDGCINILTPKLLR